MARAASSCNAFAIATFYSVYHVTWTMSKINLDDDDEALR